MSPLFRPLSLMLLTVLAAGAAEPVRAQAVPQRERHQDSRDRGQGQSDRDRRGSELSDSVRRVERETRGQVLSAERLQYDGRELNRVKVVDGQGRVRVYVDDPSQRGRSADARTRRDDEDEPNL
jgi:hypothetical protein